MELPVKYNIHIVNLVIVKTRTEIIIMYKTVYD